MKDEKSKPKHPLFQSSGPNQPHPLDKDILEASGMSSDELGGKCDAPEHRLQSRWKLGEEVVRAVLRAIDDPVKEGEFLSKVLESRVDDQNGIMEKETQYVILAGALKNMTRGMSVRKKTE